MYFFFFFKAEVPFAKVCTWAQNVETGWNPASTLTSSLTSETRPSLLQAQFPHLLMGLNSNMPSTQSVNVYAITTTVTSESPPGWTQGHLRGLWNWHLSLSPTLFYCQSDCLTFRAPSNRTQRMCWTQFLTSKSLPSCPSESQILAFLKWFRLLPCPQCHRGGIKWVRPRLWL